MNTGFNYSNYDFSHNLTEKMKCLLCLREFPSDIAQIVAKIINQEPIPANGLRGFTDLEVATYFGTGTRKTCPESWGPAFSYTLHEPSPLLAHYLIQAGIKPENIFITRK